MKSSKIIISTLTLLSIIICVMSCKNKSNIDAVTGATTKNIKEEKIILPPKSNSYIILGVMPGLNGFVVNYDDNFYRGGELYSEEGIQSLKSLGVDTILSITPSKTERMLAKKYEFRLFEIPFTKDFGLSKAELDKVITILRKENMPIYVHCHGGAHRGGIMGIVHRIYNNDWTLDKALSEYEVLGRSLKDDQKMIHSIEK